MNSGLGEPDRQIFFKDKRNRQQKLTVIGEPPSPETTPILFQPAKPFRFLSSEVK